MTYFRSFLRFVVLVWALLVQESYTSGLVEMSGGEKTPWDASDVTWAHAVNSRDALEQYLASSVDFLEADISLGYLTDSVSGISIPVMAHPPSQTSDISLDQWLGTVTSRGSDKGIKLDFKSIEVVEPSLMILKRYASKLNSSVWLNADVLPGPVNSQIVPVQLNKFLALCNLYFPNATLSLGWTTYLFPSVTTPDTWHYEWRHVRKMVDVIRCSGYKSNFPKFTFPVRGIFASRSIGVLKWLLSAVPGSSLTVWTGKYDPLEVEDLVRIRSSFPRDKVYYDVPEAIHNEFLQKKDSIDTPKNARTEDQWMTLTRGHGDSCSTLTYVSNETVVFGKSLTTAVLRKNQLMFGKDSAVKIKGFVHFFDVDDEEGVSPLHITHELMLVFVDVNLLTKNMSDASHTDLDLTTSDTEVIWSAINTSVVFTFQHDYRQKETSCRAFKLDSAADKSFEVWNIPCSMALATNSDEITRTGVPEISSRKRLVLPEGPLMFGLVSKGNEHVVVHGLTIEGMKDTYTSESGPPMIKSTGMFLLVFALCLGVFLFV